MSKNNDNILNMEIVVNNNANDDNNNDDNNNNDNANNNDNTIDDNPAVHSFLHDLNQRRTLRLLEEEEYAMSVATHRISTPKGQTNTSLRIIFTNKDGRNPWRIATILINRATESLTTIRIKAVD